MTTKEFLQIARRIPPEHPDTDWSFRAECIKNKLLIYDGKKNKAVCTCCGYDWDIAPGEYSHMHGHRDICPNCEEELLCVSAGRGRKCYEEQHRLMTFASDGKSLWIIQNDILVSFEDFGRAQLYRTLREVFMINADEQRHWRFYEGYWSPDRWDELKSFNPAPLPTSMYNAYLSRMEQHIFRYGIEEIIANSDCRYLAGEDLNRELNWPIVTSWLALQMKYPALELLRKGGFGRLAKDRLSVNGYGNYQNAVNIRAHSIEKALKLPGKWVKALRRAGISEKISSRELKAFQPLSDREKQCVIDNWEQWSAVVTSYRGEENLAKITKYTALEKYLAYMHAQGRKDTGYYCDYLNNAAALGWDLGRKSILFPPDLEQAHDDAANLRDMAINAEKDARIASHAIDLEYSTAGLVALCAKSQSELNKESAELHHCVRTYGDRVADGRTLIYFVRSSENIDKPYYTLEISPHDGKVIQCRGIRNCSMTPEVAEFKDGFERAFKKMIKAKKGETKCRAKA